MSIRRFFRSGGRFKFWASFAIIFITGVCLRAYPWEDAVHLQNHPKWQKALPNLAEGLGEALIIAVVIGALVDNPAKREMLSDFAEHVSLHIIGRWLPLELRSHLEEYLASDLIRKEWTIRYNIESWPDQPQFFRLTTVSDYTIENTGDLDRDYEFRYDVEESFIPHLGVTKILRCSGQDADDPDRYDSFEFPGDSGIQPSPRNNGLSVARSVTIPRARTFQFSAESEECFRDGSSIPFFSFYPVVNSKLIVNYPTDRLDIFVDLSFGDIDSDAIFTATETGGVWKFKKPILPGQGFSVRVYDKNSVRPSRGRRGKRRKS